MSTAYATAIDLLMNSQLDFKQIAIEVAKCNPELFVRIAKEQTKPLPVGWHLSVVRDTQNGNRINGIKTIRTHMNYGLKEAKDVSDLLVAYLQQAGRIDETRYASGSFAPYLDSVRLDRDQQELLEALLEVAGVSKESCDAQASA